MSIEGFTLLMKTSDRALRYSGSNKTKLRNQKLILGWGLPALLMVTGAGAGFATNTYMNEIKEFGYNRCWPSSQYPIFYLTVFGPLVLIYAMNLYIFGKILLFIYAMSKNSVRFTPKTNTGRSENVTNVTNAKHLKTTLKSFGLLFFVLGIPSIFSFLSGTSYLSKYMIFAIVLMIDIGIITSSNVTVLTSIISQTLVLNVFLFTYHSCI